MSYSEDAPMVLPESARPSEERVFSLRVQDLPIGQIKVRTDGEIVVLAASDDIINQVLTLLHDEAYQSDGK